MVIWALFLVRGVFYCTMLPVWEGFDEYAHFARFSQGALPRMNTPLTREVERTFTLLPMPDQLAWIGPEVKIHPKWWALPDASRAARLTAARSIPAQEATLPAQGNFQSYESQQGPLYYWVLWPFLQMAAGWNILERVLLARLLSVLLASAAIPLVWLAGRNLAGQRLGLGAAAFLAISPMFALNAARVANDCLAISWTALLLVLLSAKRLHSWWIGLVLGSVLLTKAYALTLLPALLVLLWRQRFVLGKALGLGVLLGGWWYVRNILLTGRLTGWEDDAPLSTVLRSLPAVPWVHATSTVFKTALWFGGWSFLTARAWMYNVLLAILLLCVAAGWRRAGNFRAPWVMVACFLAGMVYDVGAEFATQHATGTPGWYLWGVGAAFALLIAGGAGKWTAPVCALLCVFDLFTANFVLLPYYSGFAAHGRSFAAISQLPAALDRLAVPHVLWIAFLAAGPVILVTLLTNHEVSFAASSSRVSDALRPAGE